jgi:hypothetical protein
MKNAWSTGWLSRLGDLAEVLGVVSVVMASLSF